MSVGDRYREQQMREALEGTITSPFLSPARTGQLAAKPPKTSRRPSNKKRPVGSTDDASTPSGKITKLEKNLATQKEKVANIPSENKPLHEELLGLIANAGEGLVKGAGKGLDYGFRAMSVPQSSLVEATNQIVGTLQEEGLAGTPEALLNIATGAATGTGRALQGRPEMPDQWLQPIIPDEVKDKGDVAQTAAAVVGGFGLNMLTDPLMYVGVGAAPRIGAVAKELKVTAPLAKQIKAAGGTAKAGEKLFKSAQSAAAAENITMRSGAFAGSRKLTEELRNAALSSESLSRMANTMDDVAKYEQEIKNALKTGTVAGKPPKIVQDSVDIVLKKGFPYTSSQDFVDAVYDVADELLRQKQNTIKGLLADASSNVGKRRPAINVHLNPFKIHNTTDLFSSNAKMERFANQFGDMFDRAMYGKRKLGQVRGIKNVNKGLSKVASKFSFGEMFPGLTDKLRRDVTTAGVTAVRDKINDMVNAGFHRLTKDESKQIIYALDDDNRSVLAGVLSKKDGKPLTDFYDFAKKEFESGFQEDLATFRWGNRTPKHQMLNYVPIVPDSGFTSYSQVQKFMDIRKKFIDEAVSKGSRTIPDSATIRGAKNADFNVVDDNLGKLVLDFYMKRVERNKMPLFTSDLVNNFAQKARTVGQHKQTGVDVHNFTKIPDSQLTTDLVNALKPGEAYYLPNELAAVRKNFEAFLNSPKARNDFVRFMDKLTRSFKFFATVPNPTFHVNNMIGDTILSWMDGISFPRQTKLVQKLMNNSGGKNTVRIAGHNILVTDLINNPRHGAKYVLGEGGFYHADELNQSGTFSSRVGRVGNKMRSFSEARENIVRDAHYIAALQDEAEMLLKGKNTNLTNVYLKLKEAAPAAAERVLKSHIDYSALTPAEMSIMRRVMPFYTWWRKSIPLMLELGIRQPGRYTAPDKLKSALENALGTDSESDTQLAHIPLWLQGAGFAQLTGKAGGAGGTLLNYRPIPQSSLPETIGTGEAGFGDVLRNLTSMVNPLATAPIEVVMGKDIYTGKPISKNASGLLEQMFPQGQRLSSHLLVELLRASEGEGPENAAGWAKAAGLPITNVSENAILAELRRQQDPYDKRIAEINKTLRESGIQIMKSPGKDEWKVKGTEKDRKTNRYPVYYVSSSAGEAYKYATEQLNK